MSLEGKSIISIDDLSDSEIERILELAREFDELLPRQPKVPLLKDRKLFCLFYEASSRTYFSFREAMRRLGGDSDGILNAQSNTSVAKGESIADTIRTFELMADVVLMRHSLDGSVRLAQEYASVPLINAGDGAHEHPTQTLVDLYTIVKEKGSLKGQVVALWGDLLHARTVHSLAYALARFGAKIRTFSLPDLGLPAYVRARLANLSCDLKEYSSIGEALGGDTSVLYRAELAGNGPRRRKGDGSPQQTQAMFRLLQEFGAVYVTRLQTERFPQGEVPPREFGAITSELLQNVPEDAIILHPLPRLTEIEYTIDADKRAAYFRQMRNSIPVRMAVLALILGARESKGARPKRERGLLAQVPLETKCSNGSCVVNHERHATPRFLGDPANPRLVHCAYCDIEVVLGSEWVLAKSGGPSEREVGPDVRS